MSGSAPKIHAGWILMQLSLQDRRKEHQQRQKEADLGIVSVVGLSRVSTTDLLLSGTLVLSCLFLVSNISVLPLGRLMPAVFADELSLLDALSLSLQFIIIRPSCVCPLHCCTAYDCRRASRLAAKLLSFLIQNWI